GGVGDRVGDRLAREERAARARVGADADGDGVELAARGVRDVRDDVVERVAPGGVEHLAREGGAPGVAAGVHLALEVLAPGAAAVLPRRSRVAEALVAGTVVRPPARGVGGAARARAGARV